MRHTDHPVNVHPAELYVDQHDTERLTYALNVKVRRLPDAFGTLTETETHDAEAAWWNNAETIAKSFGLHVTQSGRSGGWCVFTVTSGGELVCPLRLAELHGGRVRDRVHALDVAERVAYAAERIRATLTKAALTELADDVRAVRCNVCGGPCDAVDSWSDGTLVLCGKVYGNGCDAFSDVGDLGDLPLLVSAVSVEHHPVDGFTCWWTDRAGVLQHRRFIGLTVTEAVAEVVTEAVAAFAFTY
jgi:hypothetical protein